MRNRKELVNNLTHTINMMKRHDTMTIACDGPFIQMMEKVREYLRMDKPQKIEIEGGGSCWWYVCPECHGTIDLSDHFCRHCGQAVEE